MPGIDKTFPIYSRDSLKKGYKDYIDLTEGYKQSIFKPSSEKWEAEDFEGNKWLLNFKGKKLVKKPLHRFFVHRKDGVKQRYWKR